MTILIPKFVGEIRLDAVKLYPYELLQKKKLLVGDQSKNELLFAKFFLFVNGCRTKSLPQLSLRIHGKYHVEKLTYFKKNPENWESWVEIIIPVEQLPQLIEVLGKVWRCLQENNKK